MKTIPISLQNHLNEDATTVCFLSRIETKEGTVYGFTSLDEDIVYDDGNGPVTYRAENGFTPSRLQATADLSVDNAELEGLVQETGITEAQIRAGLFDYAKVRIYRVNYMSLSDGHEIMDVGTAGETTFSRNGWKTEFRSLKQQLKQPISRLYSLTCRARFGSMPIGTGPDSNGDSRFEETYPCGKEFTWANATVTAVNSTTAFEATALTQSDGFYTLGVVDWLTGDNAGAQMEVGDFANDSNASNQVTLALPMYFPVQVGDAFRIRKDCSKIWDDADNGCLFHWGSDRALHFRGEPHIPIADAGQNMVPGAQITRS